MYAIRSYYVGSGTVNLPNNHPAQVAAHVAMVDHMLEGRFLFGIGPGGLRSDMEMLGNLDQDRSAMFVEAIDHILALWSGRPPYKLEGRFWKLSTERTRITSYNVCYTKLLRAMQFSCVSECEARCR